MDIDFNGKILINKINHLNANNNNNNNNNVSKNNNSSSSSNRSNSDISNKSNHSNYNNNKCNNNNSNKTILKFNKRFGPAASNNNNNSGDSVIRNESSKKTTTFNIQASSSQDKINGINIYGISNKYSKAANNNLNINNNTNHKDINNDFFFFNNNNNLNIGHNDINNNFFNKTPTVGPRVKSLKRHQLSIVLNTIPCNELFHWLVTNDVFTQKIVDNLQETYKTKRSINEAMIDLLIIYGEWAVLRFSHALLFTGQKEMHQLLEDGAEEIRKTSYNKNEEEDDDQHSNNYYPKDNRHSMEATLNYIQSTKSKKFKDMNDGKNKNNDDDDFYDAWGLLKQVELKDKFIKNLNEKLQETETKLKALNQKFKTRGKEFDEYMMDHKTDLYNQLKQNRSSHLDSMRSEKRLADEEKQLERMTKKAYEKIASMESKDSIEDLEGVFVEFPNGSDEGMKTLLEIKPTEKLKSLIDFLLKGNEQKVQLQKSLTDLKNERAKILELMSKKIGITFDQKDLHNVDFEELFENFARDVDKETEEKNEMKENLNLIREKLSKALEDNRVIKEKAMKLEDNLKMKETERNLRNQSAKEGNSTPVNNRSASKNKKVRFCDLKTTQIYPFMEKDFELVSANKPAATNFH